MLHRRKVGGGVRTALLELVQNQFTTEQARWGLNQMPIPTYSSGAEMSAVLIKKWRGWLKRIHNDQLHDLLVNRHIFGQFAECTTKYVGTATGADLAQWMAQNYIAFAVTAIGRMIEKPTKNPDPKKKSVSLVILLDDLAANSSVLTRARHRALYKNSVAVRFADRDFDAIARRKRVGQILPHRIRRDIRALSKTCHPITRLRHKVVAHTELDRRRVRKFTIGQINRAIDDLAETFRRYSLLINGSVCSPLVPVDAYDVRCDLKKIWP